MKNTKTRTQLAALPFTVRRGRLLVMLITSRQTQRWIIPKGWPKKSVTKRRQAAIEAYEEAGVIGTIADRPLGTFRYEKRLASGASVACTVETYLLAVERQADDWPEKVERQARWMTPAEAAAAVAEKSLALLFRKLAAMAPALRAAA